MPLQVVLVTLVGLMLCSGAMRRASRRSRSVAFIITALWQPGLRLLETDAQLLRRASRGRDHSGTHRMLFHGNTLHGAERMREADGTPRTGRPEPLTYYYFGGPISEVTSAARAVRGKLSNVAVVGLGAGSMACHRQEGETWTFFEIDPEVVRLARDPAMFRFLSSCAPEAPIVLGDARLTLAASPQQFDLIVLDAFSSDAIPTHLLTREALRGYLAHLAPHGMLLVHISNRHLELAKVVAAVGATEGLTTLVKTDRPTRTSPPTLRAAAMVAVLARSEADFGACRAEGWEKTEAAASWPGPTTTPTSSARSAQEVRGLARLLQQHGERLDHREAAHFAAADIAVALLAMGEAAIFRGRRRNARARPASRLCRRPGRQRR